MLTPDQIKIARQTVGSPPLNPANPTATQAKPLSERLGLNSLMSSNSFRFDAPLTAQEKITKYDNESAQYNADAKQANSFGGMASNFFNAPAMESLPFVGGAIALGKSANKAINNPFERDSLSNQALSDTNLEIMKRIHEDEAAGKDATQLKKMYNENADKIEKSQKTIENSRKALPTTGNVVGQGLHTLLDVASVGTYGKAASAMQTGKLAMPSVAPGVVASAENIAKSKAGLFTKQGAVNVLKGTLKGAAFAYPYDTVLGLEGKRGDTRTGAAALIPGKTTAFGAILGGGLATGKGLINSTNNEIAAVQAKRAARSDNLAAKISQGKVEDIPKVKSAISQIDIEGVKTEKDLKNALDNQISDTATALDNTLDSDTRKFKLNEIGNETDVGGKTVTHNYIQDGIDKLKELYTKTNDPVMLEKLNQFEQKASTEGVTIKEMNNFAKDFGNEFSSKAFSASGEPLTSVNAQALENIRGGIKDTARGYFGNDVYNEADKRMSDLIQTRNLIDKNIEAVNNLEKSIQPRGYGEQFGRLLGKVTNFFTAGTSKGFVESFIPRGRGYKQLNALDLQNSLEDDLANLTKLIEKENMPEAEATSLLQRMVDKYQNTPNQEGGFISIGGEPPINTNNPNEVAAGQIDNSNILNKANIYKDSVERFAERGGGWQPGMKEQFDTALNHGDKLTLKSLLRMGAVPKNYADSFSEEISKILNK